ncbi:MAG: hypothetical protein KDA60_09835 [Planctomycetales bacterium]|nr:hypothetical protein [Planctomycetales bacterium]
MSTDHPVRADERSAAIAYKANTWGLNCITFALLCDVIYRGWFLHEAAWDLLAIVICGGVISMAYMAKHQVLGQVFGWKAAVIGAVVAAIVAAVSAVVTMFVIAAWP